MEVSNREEESIPREIPITVYSAEITNGYVFRQIFELYDKLVMEGIPIYFKESGITIRTGTSSSRDSMKLISDIEIYTDDIIEYYMNKKLATIKASDEDEDTACYIEELNINTVKSVFKSIAKSNSVRIYKTTLSDDVFIEIKGLTTEHSRLTTSKYRKIHYDVSDYQDDEKPNLKIEISQFCTTMKGMTRGDAEYTSFKVFPKGMKIEGRNGTGSITKDMCWGEVPGAKDQTIDIEHDPDDYFETKVSSSSIKALTKISGMSNYSIIKIISVRNGLLRLNHKIGDFGEHNIYLVDNS